MKRSTLYIICSVALILVIAGLAYYYLFYKKTNIPATPPETPPATPPAPAPPSEPLPDNTPPPEMTPEELRAVTALTCSIGGQTVGVIRWMENINAARVAANKSVIFDTNNYAMTGRVDYFQPDQLAVAIRGGYEPCAAANLYYNYNLANPTT